MYQKKVVCSATLPSYVFSKFYFWVNLPQYCLYKKARCFFFLLDRFFETNYPKKSLFKKWNQLSILKAWIFNNCILRIVFELSKIDHVLLFSVSLFCRDKTLGIQVDHSVVWVGLLLMNENSCQLKILICGIIFLIDWSNPTMSPWRFITTEWLYRWL